MSVQSCVGYFYELDDSYDESDEEEVRAHLRRVAEQPPLKLDDSTEVNPHNIMHDYQSAACKYFSFV